MKNKIIKISFILALSSCLMFTACGVEETVAPVEESTTENTMESTIEEVEETETESVEESDIENDTVNEIEEVEEETIDKSELNDIGNESYNGEDEPVVEEEPVVETPADDEGTPYTLTEGDKEALRMLGATEDEINAIKTEQQFIALLDILTQRGGLPSGGNSDGGNSGSGNSGSGNSGGSGSGNSGGESSGPSGVEGNDNDLPTLQLNPGDGSLPGSM